MAEEKTRLIIWTKTIGVTEITFEAVSFAKGAWSWSYRLKNVKSPTRELSEIIKSSDKNIKAKVEKAYLFRGKN